MPVKHVVALALLLLVPAPGCSAFHPNGPTDVARGEYHSTGRPEYDSFFILLHEKQVELLSAPEEPRAARQALTRTLELTPEASDAALAQRLRLELQKLAGRGLQVRLEVPPPSAAGDASATLHVSEGVTPSVLRTALPQESSRLVRSRNRMLVTRAEIEKLRVMAITLEGSVDAAFRTQGPWKRDEVRDNLSDAQKVMTLMTARTSEVESKSSQLLALLGAVAVTDPSLGQPVASTPVDEALSRRAVRPGRSAIRSGTSPRPTSSPPAKVVRGAATEDDAPTPRPTVGSAPAEIEP